MHRTLWTLILALALQLLAGSSWALPLPAHETTVAHCHEVAMPDDSGQLHGPVADSHHCCAVGVGVGVQPLLPTLSQRSPITTYGPWVSQRLRPDLPPPI